MPRVFKKSSAVVPGGGLEYVSHKALRECPRDSRYLLEHCIPENGKFSPA